MGVRAELDCPAEGLTTALFGIAWFFFLPDFPEEAKFLNQEERDFVKKRLAADVGASSYQEKATWRDNLAVFKDCQCLCNPFFETCLFVDD